MTDEQGIIYSDDGKLVLGVTDDFDAAEVVIPEGVTDIAPYCFNSDVITFGLKRVKLPTTLKRVGCLAFVDCGDENLQIDGEFDHLTLYGNSGGWFDTPVKVRRIAVESTNEDNSLQSFGEYGFQDWKHLEEIIITCDIQGISNPDFAGCENLRKVTFCGECGFIAKGAFAGCDKLEEINIPATTEIEDGAFDGKNAWRNKFVDLGLPSGTRWERTNLGSSDQSPWGQAMNAFQWNERGLLSSIPSNGQFSELISLCSWKYMVGIDNGETEYNAYQITGLNGNSIMLPVKNLVPGDNVAFYGSVDETNRAFSLAMVRPSGTLLTDLDSILPCFLRKVYKPC